MKILKYTKIIINSLFKNSKLSRKFVFNNLKLWKNYKCNTSKGILLLDYIQSFENEIPRTYFANIFSKKNQSKIYVFSDQKSILLNQEWIKNYKSFNVKKFIYIFYSKFFFKLFFSFKKKSQLNKYVHNIFSNINSKMDIMNLKYNDIEIGREIYAEYLMRYKKPTVNLRDECLKNIIKEAVLIVEFWLDFFKTNKVVGVSLTHPNVRFLALVGKIANENNIPVYCVTNTYIVKRLNLTNHYNFIRNELFDNREIFKKLSSEEKQKAIEWSKNRLNLRLGGKIGVDMHYTKETAFHKKNYSRALRDNNKKKSLICTHEFYDDPNWSGGFLFPDFLEWLNFLGNISKNTNCEWYLKNHPDTDKWTQEVITDYLKKFNHITLVDEKTSFIQLRDEGLNFVFTAHGTVGHECPLLGIQVINADLNHPHAAYNFNVTPKNLNELKQIILNLENYTFNTNIDEIYEYYYVAKRMKNNDNLIFNSYSKAKDLELQGNVNILDIFLEQLDRKKHDEIVSIMSKKIDEYIDYNSNNIYKSGINE